MLVTWAHDCAGGPFVASLHRVFDTAGVPRQHDGVALGLAGRLATVRGREWPPGVVGQSWCGIAEVGFHPIGTLAAVRKRRQVGAGLRRWRRKHRVVLDRQTQQAVTFVAGLAPSPRRRSVRHALADRAIRARLAALPLRVPGTDEHDCLNLHDIDVVVGMLRHGPVRDDRPFMAVAAMLADVLGVPAADPMTVGMWAAPSHPAGGTWTLEERGRWAECEDAGVDPYRLLVRATTDPHGAAAWCHQHRVTQLVPLVHAWRPQAA